MIKFTVMLLLKLSALLLRWSIGCEKFAMLLKKYSAKYVLVRVLATVNDWLVYWIQRMDVEHYRVWGNETRYPGLDFSAPPKVRAVVGLALAVIDHSPSARIAVKPKALAIARAVYAGKSIDSDLIMELFEFFTRGNITEDNILEQSEELRLEYYLYGGAVGRTSWVNSCVNMCRDAQLHGRNVTPLPSAKAG